MASETAATNHSSEEVEKELKPEVKIMEAVQVSSPKKSVDSTEPEEVPNPVATFTESGAKVEETKTEPIVNENIKGIDSDQNPKAEESDVLVEESKQKNENKHVEVPPGEEENKIEDASNNKYAEVEKVPHPEPDVTLFTVSSSKNSVDSTEPEEVLAPVATFAESGAKVEETNTEPIVNENTKGIDSDQNPKAEESDVSIEESKQKNENKHVEVPPGEVENKIEDASDNKYAEVEKVPHPEPDVNSVTDSSVTLFTVSSPKNSVDSTEPEEAPAPVATFAESGAKVEETKTEPIVNENIKRIDSDQNPKAEKSDVWVEESKQKNENKHVEVPPGEEENKIEDASDNKYAEMEKVPHPEPDVNSVTEESIFEKIEGEPEEKLDTNTVEKQEESKVEPSVEEKLSESEKVVEVSKQLPAERAAREYIGNVEVLPDKEMEESEAELAKVEKAEEKKDGVDTETVEKQEEPKVEPSVEEKLGEPEKVAEVSKQLPAKRAAREFIGNVEVMPDKEMEETEAELAKVEKAEEKKDELEKIIIAGEQSSIEAVVEKVENVDKNPGEQVKTIEEKEVKGAESKPEETSETEPVEKLEQSTVESIEEKQEEPGETVQVPLQSSVDPVEDKVEVLEELPVKEVEVIVEKEGTVSEAEPAEKQEDFEVKPVDEQVDEPTKTAEKSSVEAIGEIVEKTLPAKEVEETAVKKVDVSETEIKPEETEKLEESKVELPEEKPDEPKERVKAVEEEDKSIDKVEELPSIVVEEIQEAEDKEPKVSEVESKPEEISETKPIESVEEKSVQPEKIVDVPVQTSFLEKLGEAEELHAKEMKAIDDKEPEKIPQTEPAEKLEGSEVVSVEEKPDESIKIVDVQEQSSPEIDKVKPEEISESTPEEKLVEQSEVTEQHEKEPLAAEPFEKESKVLEAELKPEKISKSTLEEKLIEQSEVTEQSEKEPPTAEPVENEADVFEAELHPGEISESTPKEKLVKQSEVTEQSVKEPPASEPVEQGKVQALAERVDETKLSNKEEPNILETRVEEVSEKADAPNEQKESIKNIVEIDPQPEEKVVDSGKTELENGAQEDKSVATRELIPCEAKPTESEATEKLVKEEVTSRDIELLAENGNAKNEAEVEGNGNEEATKEAEKCEPATQIENIGRSLKEKLEQEKRDDETTKIDVQTEATNESEDTKAAEDAYKEEVSVKTSQKQSNNIMKMVKHSLVKAKKAIIGKSANSKAPVSEIKGDEVSK